MLGERLLDQVDQLLGRERVEDAQLADTIVAVGNEPAPDPANYFRNH